MADTTELSPSDIDLLAFKTVIGPYVGALIGNLQECAEDIQNKAQDEDETLGRMDFVVAWLAAFHVAGDKREGAPELESLIELIRRVYPLAQKIMASVPDATD